MEARKPSRNNHTWSTTMKSKASIVPNMELITENVFIPVTKVIFARNSETMYRDPSKRKIQLVKTIQCNSNVTMPLLKRPLCVPVKRYASAVSYGKQTNKSNERERTKLPKKTTAHLIKKSSVFMNPQPKDFTGRVEKKKTSVPLFPSSVFDLPLNSIENCKALPTNKNLVASKQSDKRDKVSGTGTHSSIGRIATSYSGMNRYYKKRKLKKKTVGVPDRPLNSTRHSKCTSTSVNGKIELVENDVAGTPLTSKSILSAPNPSTVTTSAIATIALNPSTTTEINQDQYPTSSYSDTSLRKINATVKGTESDVIVNQGGEIKFPVQRIDSNAFRQVQCTTFDLTASDNFYVTNETTKLGNEHYNIPSTRNIGRSPWQNYPILSLMAKNQTRYQNDTDLQKTDHHHACKIKYSWQVLGTSSQTSRTLLDSLIKENAYLENESVCNCSVKYSWQIIGIATQTSKKDITLSECRSVISVFPAKISSARRNNKTMSETPVTVTVWRNGKRFIVLNNQSTQTFAHKDSQTIFTEFYA